MNRFILAVLSTLSVISCSANSALQPLVVTVPTDFQGPIYFVGTASETRQFAGEILVPANGLLLRSSLAMFKGKALKDIQFRSIDGRLIRSADANTKNKGIYVWNVGLGTGKLEDEVIEYIVVFIGTRDERNKARTHISDIRSVYDLVKKTRVAEGKNNGSAK